MHTKMVWPLNSLSTREIFTVVHGDSIVLQSVPVGTDIPVSGFVIYDDEKDNGDCVEVMILISPDGSRYATISSSVKRLVVAFVDTVEDADAGFSIRPKIGLTKAGRKYLTVDIV